MMWRFCNFFFAIIFIFLIISSCKNTLEKTTFTYNKLGYWYQLISFNNNALPNNKNTMYWLSATFKTQSDSVFWDSYNNLNDNFFIALNPHLQSNYLSHFISTKTEQDSCLLLIKTSDFFAQQFNTHQIPFFSKNDSVVKINLKVKRIYSQAQFKNLQQNFAKKELEQIENYFNSVQKFEASKDSLGFYWIDKPTKNELPKIKNGDDIYISYQGSFLNGQIIDSSPKNFKITYGTPDQLLKGLNYVISRLKLGDNAKIILPSRLTFGEKGSTNNLIPPYTPLVYTLKINE